MKILISYYSKYGATEKYAKWLSDELDADIVEIDAIDSVKLGDYDIFILGAGIYAGSSKLKKVVINNKDLFSEKNVILFTVGASLDNDETKEEVFGTMFKKGLAPNYKTFILRGSFDFEKLTKEDKLLMHMFLQKIKFDKKLKEKSRDILKCIDNPSDWTNKAAINQIVSAVKIIEEKKIG